MVKTICSVCQNDITEKYCAFCGQKKNIGKSTMLGLITDFIGNMFSFERSGFASIYKTLRHPRFVVDNYYQGFRNYYYSPGKLMLFSIAAIAIHVGLFDSDILGLTLEAENVKAQYLFWFTLFPVLLLISYIAFFKTEKKFVKHVISVTYVGCSLLIVILLLTDLIRYAFGDVIGIYSFVVFITLVLFWNSIVFSKDTKWKRLFLNTLLQIGIFMIIVIILVNIANLVVNHTSE